jgi:hypothetical protein
MIGRQGVHTQGPIHQAVQAFLGKTAMFTWVGIPEVRSAIACLPVDKHLLSPTIVPLAMTHQLGSDVKNATINL